MIPKEINKKGLSLMVSYVLLVILAIGLSIVAYSYLSQIPPSEREECPANTNLIIEDPECLGTENPLGGVLEANLSLTFVNRGFFNVSAVFVRIGKSYTEIRTQVNKDDELLPEQILPGNSSIHKYNITGTINELGGGSGTYIVEIQPAILSKKKALIPCEAVITQEVECIW